MTLEPTPRTQPDNEIADVGVKKHFLHDLITFFWPEDDGDKVVNGYRLLKATAYLTLAFLFIRGMGLVGFSQIMHKVIGYPALLMTLLYFLCTPSTDRKLARSFYILAAAFFAIGGVAIGISSTDFSDKEASSQVVPSAEQHDGDDERESATPTLQYWQSLVAARKQLRVLRETFIPDDVESLEQVKAALVDARASLDEIRRSTARLPVLGVNPEVLELGSSLDSLIAKTDEVFLDVQDWVQRAEAANANATSVESMVESVIRGFMGDPLGKFNDVQAELADRKQETVLLDQSVRDLVDRDNEWVLRAGRLRARLTQQYGVEFLPIE
jgi:hypothetical protein